MRPTPQPLPPGHSPGPDAHLPDVGAVDGTDPAAISRAVVILMWSVDTTADTSQHDAELRAAPYLTPSYAAALTANPPVAAPGADWQTWTSHRAYTIVTAILGSDEMPSDTATTAYRQWVLTVVAAGRDGWRSTPQTIVAYVALTRTGPATPWQVDKITQG